jgi:hypothetical protein
MADPRLAPSDLLGGPAEMPLSCSMVFHSPHPSQRPDHLLKLAPQDVHENVTGDFAMRLFG